MNSLWGRIEAALHKYAESPAVLQVEEPGCHTSITGGQLLEMVNRVADLLAPACSSQGPSQATLSLYLSNSAAYVAAVLAAVHLGLPFLPLDPRWPPARLAAVAADARPAAVAWAPACLPGGHGPPPLPTARLLQLPADLLEPGPALQPGAGQQAQQVQPVAASFGARSSTGSSSNGCCYVLYTSGSTGAPLGVHGTTAGLLNRCDWMQNAFPLVGAGSAIGPGGSGGAGAPEAAGGDRVAFRTAPCFVDSVWEVFGPLLAGVPLLLQVVAEHRITRLSAVPTVWAALLACAEEQAAAVLETPGARAAPLASLRVAVSSGEPLAPALLRRLQAALPACCRLLNLYGSTEAAADVTFADVTSYSCSKGQQGQGQQATQELGRLEQRQREQLGQGSGAAEGVPVGHPISNTLVAILLQLEEGEGEGAQPPAPQQQNKAQPESAAAAGAASAGDGVAALPTWWRPLAAGEVGEVVVGGPAVAAGYLTAPAPASHRFQRLPCPAGGQRQLLRQLRDKVAAGGRAVAVGEVTRASKLASPGLPVFRTGDLGWLDGAGCLHLCGRADLQAKFAGVRVDLTEVEAILAQHPEVRAAATRAWQLAAGTLLVAYVELCGAAARSGAAGSDALPAQLEAWCRQQLPPAAVPSIVMVLPQLPRSPAGKLDRGALPKPRSAAAPQLWQQDRDAEQPGQQDVSPAQSQQLADGAAPGVRKRARLAAAASPQLQPTADAPPERLQRVSEVAVGRVFASALGHTAFEPTQSLFELGGMSMTATVIADSLRLAPEEVFQHPTVRSLAAHLNTAAAPGDQQRQQRGAGAEAAPAPGTLATALLLPLPLPGAEAAKQPAAPGQAALSLAWRARLLACIDASPLPASVFTPEAAGADAQRCRLVFACSHGGDVRCMDAASGRLCWRADLPGRADAGMALCSSGSRMGEDERAGGAGGLARAAPQQRQALAVATNDGGLHLLDPCTGEMLGTLDAGGDIRAAPVLDPWLGLLWVPTHAAALLAVSPPPVHDYSASPSGGAVATAAAVELTRTRLPATMVVARADLPAAASAEVAFDCKRRLAFAACLDGSLVAFDVQLPVTSGNSAGLSLQLLWQHRCAAPLFAPAAPLTTAGVVAAAAVDGSIVGLDCSSGQPRWEHAAGGAVYAPMLLAPLPAAAGEHTSAQGACQALLAGTHGGVLLALDPCTGAQLAAWSAGEQITGLAAVRQHVVAVTTANGAVALLRLSSSAAHAAEEPTVQLVAAVRLPCEVFAPPAVLPAAGGGEGSSESGEEGDSPAQPALLVGSRDDCLYCLELAPWAD
eukprot:scaffold2.g6889.t1